MGRNLYIYRGNQFPFSPVSIFSLACNSLKFIKKHKPCYFGTVFANHCEESSYVCITVLMYLIYDGEGGSCELSFGGCTLDTVTMGGRRTGIERRQFSYIVHVPERRSGKARRSGLYRRSEINQMRQNGVERRAVFKS